MPNVYIALGTYQGEAYLPELLESIRRQSYRDWTLLARDDGSTDATLPILRRAAAEDQRIVVWDEDRRRRGAAGNFGLLMQQAFERARSTSSSPTRTTPGTPTKSPGKWP